MSTEMDVERTRNRRGEGGRLREDIVRAAAELLDETGQQSVTLRAVARRVGIAAPSIYGHFRDRELILLAVVQQAFGELSTQLQEAAQSADPIDPVERLRAVSAAYLDFAQRRPQRYRVMFGGLYDVTEAVRSASISQTEAQALGQEALAVIVEALRACVATGRSRSTDPWSDATTLWVALHGLAHQRAVIPHFPWPDDIAERIVERVAQLDTGQIATASATVSQPTAETQERNDEA